MSNDYFEVWKLNRCYEVKVENVDPYCLVTVIKGTEHVQTDVHEYAVTQGDSFIIPWGVQSVVLKGKLETVVGRPTVLVDEP